jgi:hypothetical protein
MLHLLLAQVEVVAGVASKTAVFVVGSVSALVAATSVGVLARRFLGARALPVAVVLFGLADMVLVLTLTNLNPGVLVLAYGAVLLLCVWQTLDAGRAIVFVLVIFATVLAHQLTGFALLILVTGMWIGARVVSRQLHRRGAVNGKLVAPTLIGGVVVVLFGLVTGAVWLFHGNADGTPSFGTQMLARLWRAFNDPLIDPSGSPYVVGLGQYSLISTALYHTGYLVLVFLGVVGVLWLVQKRTDMPQGMAIVVGLLLVLAVTYVSPITGLKQALIPHRFLPISYIPFVVAACSGLLWLLSLVRMPLCRVGLAGTALAAVAFLMVTTPFVAWDTPYEQSRAHRTALMESEVAAVNHVLMTVRGCVELDTAVRTGLRGTLLPPSVETRAIAFGDDMRFETSTGCALLVRSLLVDEEVTVAGRGTFGGGARRVVGVLPLIEGASRVSVASVYANREAALFLSSGGSGAP